MVLIFKVSYIRVFGVGACCAIDYIKRHVSKADIVVWTREIIIEPRSDGVVPVIAIERQHMSNPIFYEPMKHSFKPYSQIKQGELLFLYTFQV